MPYKIIYNGEERSLITKAQHLIRKSVMKDCYKCPSCGTKYHNLTADFVVDENFVGGEIWKTRIECKECRSVWETVPYWVPKEFPNSDEFYERNPILSEKISNGDINPSRYFLETPCHQIGRDEIEELRNHLDPDTYELKWLTSIIRRGYGLFVQFVQSTEIGIYKEICNQLLEDANNRGYYIETFDSDKGIYLYGNEYANGYDANVWEIISKTASDNAEWVYWSKFLLYESDLIIDICCGSNHFTGFYDIPRITDTEIDGLGGDGVKWKDFRHDSEPVVVSPERRYKLAPKATIEGEQVDMNKWLTERVTQDMENRLCEIW